MTHSKTEARNIQDEGASYFAIKYGSAQKQQQHSQQWNHDKGIQDASERAPHGHNWGNLSKKIGKVAPKCNPKHKINIHASILI